MVIEFDGTTEPAGLEMYDPIEQRRLHIRTPEPAAPRPIPETEFCFPVDTACAIETESVVFDQKYSVDVHDGDGRWEKGLKAGETIHLGADEQFVGLGGPIKVYCRVAGDARLEAGINSIRLEFSEPTDVEIGARSLHENPHGTITTPDDPESMMSAVSAFSSALKTTSPERSWPTLRGHPPLIERGPELDVPDPIEPIETPVTIEVPATHRNVYTVAPLAFYLGADVRPGGDPAIVTDRDRYELGVGMSLEDDVARTLKHVFLLDCLVRMNGLFQYDLYERSALDGRLPFSLSETYRASLTERLDRYLDVPVDLLEPYVPRWSLTAHVPSIPEGIEVLPFVVNELGIVREPSGQRVESVADRPAGEAQLLRSAGTARAPVFTPGEDDGLDLVEPDVTGESIEHAWFGSQVPRGASKGTIEAFRSQLERGERNRSIEILLVCNDARMIEEHDVLDDTYGARETLPFDVHSEFGVTTDELADLLTDGGYDFLHYIGHATPNGLRCSDGELDVRTLPSIDLGVFFLNACRSYEQGYAMAERGAFGGVATLADVANEGAVEMGETIARLLNLGFPLRAALELARETTVLGNRYLIVGDGSTDIAQTDGGAPTVVKIEEQGDVYDVVLRTYPTKELPVGTVSSPNIESNIEKRLTPCDMELGTIEHPRLSEYLLWIDVPILHGNELIWNENLTSIDFL
ncbi:hypothetical protein [Saliphagus sp. LR7]|uniref:hypothetical protein n=1 Tax=Saliphagus sp. LR7 TaxID=2282654 RepID=UPI000DF7D96A|nr:hypothetical protein [Saliphagus sp. LR7]